MTQDNAGAPTAVTGKNSNLTAARRAKKDAFYTRLEDIEDELQHYRQHFRGRTVLLNCDNPETSNFWTYFARNFDRLGLERLISTHYTGPGSEDPPPSYALELCRDPAGNPVDLTQPIRTELTGDGDFRSAECVELLQQSDVVVTNPPFSLFREYVAQLVEHGKQFLVLGNLNAITYKKIWPLIQDGRMWWGPSISSGAQAFRVPDAYPLEAACCWVDEGGVKWIRVKGVRWFTNLDHDRRHHEKLRLTQEYSPEKYPRYDNHDAINVDRVADIPADYDGAMGVPITFLDKYNPEQFEIIGLDTPVSGEWLGHGPVLNGKTKYRRIIIRRKG